MTKDIDWVLRFLSKVYKKQLYQRTKQIYFKSKSDQGYWLIECWDFRLKSIKRNSIREQNKYIFDFRLKSIKRNSIREQYKSILNQKVTKDIDWVLRFLSKVYKKQLYQRTKQIYFKSKSDQGYWLIECWDFANLFLNQKVTKDIVRFSSKVYKKQLYQRTKTKYIFEKHLSQYGSCLIH